MFTNSLSLNFPCLAPKDSGSESEMLSSSLNHREPVVLNIYDMVSSGQSIHMFNVSSLFVLFCLFVCLYTPIKKIIFLAFNFSTGSTIIRQTWELAFITLESKSLTPNLLTVRADDES